MYEYYTIYNKYCFQLIKDNEIIKELNDGCRVTIKLCICIRWCYWSIRHRSTC